MDTLIMDLQICKNTTENLLIDYHKHNGYELIIVLDGQLNVCVNNQNYTVESNSVIMISPLQTHQIISTSQNYLRSYMLINNQLLDKLLNPALLTMLKSNFDKNKIFVLDNLTMTELCHRFEKIKEELLCQKKLFDTLICNEVVNIFITLYRNYNAFEGNYNETISTIQAYIENNYNNIKSIEDLSRHFNISNGHLSRLFKKYSGYSTIEYLLNVRLYNATLYLTNTKENIQSISSMVGFSDYNNFIRTFKKKYNIPPNEFRKRNLNLH